MRHLQTKGGAVKLQLCDTWLREFQVRRLLRRLWDEKKTGGFCWGALRLCDPYPTASRLPFSAPASRVAVDVF